MKKSILLALLVMSNCVFSAFAVEKSYINGIDANYPPFAFVDESGTPTGFDVEALNWIAKKMGFTVTHQPVDWDAIIPALQEKKIDMVCSGLSISPERAARATFTEPYWEVHKVFLVRADSTLTLPEILNGKKRVGVQRGTNDAEELQKSLDVKKANYHLSYCNSWPHGIENLLEGRIDALGLDSAPAKEALDRGKNVKIVGTFGKTDLFAVATRNEDAELRNILNEGYRHLMADPYWREIQLKYIR